MTTGFLLILSWSPVRYALIPCKSLLAAWRHTIVVRNTVQQSSVLLAAATVPSTSWSTFGMGFSTFPSWEMPWANGSENRMLRSLTGHWDSFFLVQAHASQKFYCTLSWPDAWTPASWSSVLLTHFWPPLIFSWIQTVWRSLYLMHLLHAH